MALCLPGLPASPYHRQNIHPPREGVCGMAAQNAGARLDWSKNPFSVDLVEDVTECRCEEPGCRFCESTDTDPGAVADSAEHAEQTHHSVTTRRVTVRRMRCPA